MYFFRQKLELSLPGVKLPREQVEFAVEKLQYQKLVLITAQISNQGAGTLHTI